MSQWGIFKGEIDEGVRQYHVAPWLPDGRFPVRHSKHEFCQCGPRKNIIGKCAVWVHQDSEPDQP